MPADFVALKRILETLSGEEERVVDEAAAERVAQLMFDMRITRARLFPSSMFNEPAWDMLLALYIGHEAAAAADLARHTETPISTAMRWIEYLENHKLIIRDSSPADRRAHTVRLTDQARANMRVLFSEVLSRWP